MLKQRTILYLCTVSVVLLVIMAVVMSSAKTVSVDELNDALFAACENGNVEEVRRLLAQGADVNSTPKGPFSETPLMRAASQGQVHVVEELILRGVDVNARSWRGVTALMKAAWWSNDAKALEVLLDHGAEWNWVL